MLYQTDFCLEPRLTPAMQSELAVKVHGAAMNAVTSVFAAQMHTNEYHPFSIFTVAKEDSCTLRVSALCDDASIIPDALALQPAIMIYTGEGIRHVPILMQIAAAPIPAEAAAERVPENGCRLTFASPAMVRIQSQPSAKPDLCVYFYSVIRKYNLFEHAALDYQAFQEAFRAVRFGSYALSSASYQITGRVFPGMKGYCDLIFPRDAGQRRLLRLCLGYAAYCGVGSKTTQGMGGIFIEPLPGE